MGWSSARFESIFVNHVIHDSILEDSLKYLIKEYEKEPIDIRKLDSYRIDPGGMIRLGVTPFECDIDDVKVCINPEHILDGLFLWKNKQVLEDSGMIKVVLWNAYVIIPEDFYFKVGTWLSTLTGSGYKARIEMAEKLNLHPNFLVIPPKDRGET